MPTYLCVVSQDKRKLNPIAQYAGNRFNNGAPNVDLEFRPDSPGYDMVHPADVGVWEIDRIQSGYNPFNRPFNRPRITKFRKELEPIQVFEHSGWVRDAIGRLSPKDIRAPRIAFLANNGRRVLIEKNKLDFSNGSVSLKPNALEAIQFTGGAETQTNIGGSPFLYLDTTSVQPLNPIRIQDPNVAVKAFLLDQGCRNAMTDLQAIANFRQMLQTIDIESTFASELANWLGCDTSTAQGFLHSFEQTINNVSIGEEIDNRLTSLLENNTSFRQRCITFAQIEYQQTIEAAVIPELTSQKQQLEDDIRRLQLENDELKFKNETLDGNKKQLEGELEKVRKLISNTETALEQKLSAIQADPPAFFAESVLLRHLMSPCEAMPRPSGILCGKAISPSNPVTDFENARKLLTENLKKAGFDGSPPLVRWLCACTALHRNLFLAGPNAEALAYSVSLSFFSADPGILDCAVADICDAELEIAKATSSVWIVRSPFEPKWVSRLPGMLERLPQKRFFLCHPFSEDLSVEPASMFRHLVPILTEPFVRNFPSAETPVSGRWECQQPIISANLPRLSELVPFGDSVPIDDISRLFHVACQMNHPDKTINPINTRRMLWLLAVLPWATLLEKKEGVMASIRTDVALTKETIRSGILSHFS